MNKYLISTLMINFTISILSIISAPILVFSLNLPEYALTEGGCLEMTQAFVLVCTFAVYVAALMCKGGKDEKMITLFFAALTYAFILREVDFDKMNLPNVLLFMLYGHGRTATLAIAFAIALIGAAIRFKTYLNSTLKFLFSTRGLLIALSCALLWTGYFFERHVEGAMGEILEETSELIGYLMLLLSSAITLKRSHSQQ